MAAKQRILERLERPSCRDGALELPDQARLEFGTRGIVYIAQGNRREIAPERIGLQLSDWAEVQTGLLAGWRKPRHWLHVRLTGVGPEPLRLSASVANASRLDGIPDQNQPGFVVPLEPLVEALETALALGATMARGIEMPAGEPLLLEPAAADSSASSPLEPPSTTPAPEQVKAPDALRKRRVWWSVGTVCLFLFAALYTWTGTAGAIVAMGWCSLGFHAGRWGWGVSNADPIEHTRRWLPRYIGPHPTSKKGTRDGLEWSIVGVLGIFYGTGLIAQVDDAQILDELQTPILIWLGMNAAIAVYNFAVEVTAAVHTSRLLFGGAKHGVLLPGPKIPLQRVTHITSYSRGNGKGRSHWHDFSTQLNPYPTDVTVETSDRQLQIQTHRLRWAVDQAFVDDTDERIIWRLPAFARVLVLDGKRPLLFATHKGAPRWVLVTRLCFFAMSTVGIMAICATLAAIVLGR